MKNKQQLDELFLQALKASLENQAVDWDMELQPEDWLALIQMAESHHVLPMFFEAVYSCPAAQPQEQLFLPLRQRVMQIVTRQIVATSDFLRLLQAMQSAGITPLVVKGIVCRELYPNPDHRVSGDEDVLVMPEQFAACHPVLTEFGMQPSGQVQDNGCEVSYKKTGSPLYLELHKQLFPPASDAYGEFNRFFVHAPERSVQERIQGVAVPTLGYTDHLFYLICHALKHFLHSGFGIRQVCDICLFANAHGKDIDWQTVLRQCREIRGERFAAALFRIGRKYLTFDPERACYPVQWQAMEVDETAMLADLLDSGVYGGGTMSRKHSSNITLNAVSAEKQGKTGKNGVLRTAFPPAAKLVGRYPYLKGKPYLLPVAWADRILKYRKETAAGKGDNSAAESIRIGNERIALMRQYGILK